MQWLRLVPIMEWLPHSLQTYGRCLTTFICCGMMGIWIYHYHHANITTCVHPNLGSQLKSCITAGIQRMSLCSDWGSLLLNMEWFPHPLPTYKRCFTTFIWCGWAYGISSDLKHRLGQTSQIGNTSDIVMDTVIGCMVQVWVAQKLVIITFYEFFYVCLINI